jgi:hypothetical protein
MLPLEVFGFFSILNIHPLHQFGILIPLFGFSSVLPLNTYGIFFLSIPILPLEPLLASLPP